MKNFILTLLMFTITTNANELSWVDKQVEAIKPPRSGLENTTMLSISDPFIFLKKNKTEKKDSKGKTLNKTKTIHAETSNKILAKTRENKLYLDAIINQSALINGKWYKLYDRIGNYTLLKVDRTSVILTKDGKSNKKTVLSTRSINKTLNFKNK